MGTHSHTISLYAKHPCFRHRSPTSWLNTAEDLAQAGSLAPRTNPNRPSRTQCGPGGAARFVRRVGCTLMQAARARGTAHWRHAAPVCAFPPSCHFSILLHIVLDRSLPFQPRHGSHGPFNQETPLRVKSVFFMKCHVQIRRKHEQEVCRARRPRESRRNVGQRFAVRLQNRGTGSRRGPFPCLFYSSHDGSTPLSTLLILLEG